MTDPHDSERAGILRAQLLDLPAPAPDDDVFAGIVTAGRRRVRRRNGLAVAVAVGLVAVVAAAVPTLANNLSGSPVVKATQAPQPATSGSPVATTTASAAASCTTVDLNADIGAGMIDNLSPDDRYDVRMITTKACQLTGPLRLEQQDAAGSWQPVVNDAAWRWTDVFDPQYQASGTQDATPTSLDPSFMYTVELGWHPAKHARCAQTDVRLVGPDVTLPLGPLPLWCHEPIAVSNTFVFTKTHSIAWTLVDTHDKTIDIAFDQQCNGVRAEAIETPTSVTIVALYVEIPRRHGCLPMTIPSARAATVTLKAPLGSREIRHAPVGPWQAEQLPPSNV